MFIHAAATSDVVGECKFDVWPLLFYGFEDFDGFFHYFGADMIAGEDEDAIGLRGGDGGAIATDLAVCGCAWFVPGEDWGCHVACPLGGTEDVFAETTDGRWQGGQVRCSVRLKRS